VPSLTVVSDTRELIRRGEEASTILFLEFCATFSNGRDVFSVFDAKTTFNRFALIDGPALFVTASADVPFHPSDILVNPALEKSPAAWSDVPGLVEQPVLCVNERFGCAKRRHVQVGEDIAQMLLCYRRSNSAHRHA
jgi:hypothetical protein